MSTNETQLVNTMACEKHKCKKIEIEDPLNNIMALLNKDSKNIKKTIYICAECEKEIEEKEKRREKIILAEEEKNKRKEEFNKIYKGIPRIYQGVKYEDISNHKVITDFTETGSGFLFIHGTCGCGKTHAMCSIKKNMNIKNMFCILFFASEIFLTIRKSFSEKEESEESIIRKCSPKIQDPFNYIDHFAIFDDIGAQKISDYVIEVWYNIINDRYMNGYKTIFTSNLSLKEISLTMSDRIASRLASGIVYEMQGNDRRLIK
jgi:DNA replication protein DnaC